MRTIRNFFILIILTFSIVVRPVHATDSYFAVPGCTTDASVPCQSKGDVVSTVIDLTNAQSLIAQIATQLLGSDNIVLRLIGSLKPLGSYKSGSKSLTQFADQVQNASDTDLNPATLQTLEKHDETTKSGSMTSRICVYEPTKGTLISDTVVSNDTIVTGEIPWIRPAVEGSRRLSSFTTNYVQESQDFNLPNITIEHTAAFHCEKQLSGQDKQQEDLSFQNQNTYGGGTNIIAKVAYSITSEILKLFQSSSPPTAKIVGTGQTPYAAHADALTAGCASTADLADAGYASNEQKQKLCEAGGFINSMYRPSTIDASYKSELNANDPDQQWQQTVTNDTPTAKNSNAFAGRIDASGQYMNCTLLPASYQGTAFPNAACDVSWAANSSGADCGSCTTANVVCDEEQLKTAPPMQSLQCAYSVGKIEGLKELGATMKQAGDYFGVPPQILAGVQYIETGIGLPLSSSYKPTSAEILDYSVPGHYDPHFCETNICGAVGPVQLSIKACDYSQCQNAKNNYTEWCTFRSGANDIRNDPTYKPNPNNYLDAYATLSKKFKQAVGNVKRCDPWTMEEVKHVACSYFGSCSANYTKDWLYEIAAQWTPDIASYALVTPKKLTYGEFVWVYYLTHR